MAQEWSFKSVPGGYLLVNGQGTCADDTGDGVTGSSFVYLVSYACSSTDHAQIWKWNGQQIQNAYNNGCINDPASSTTDGQQLVIYSCGANQPNAEWYETAPPAPTVSITAPSNGATVSGASVSVSGQASVSPGSITKITLSVAGASLGSCANATNCSASWDSTSVSNGSYTVVIAAATSGGATGQVTETIQVSNASPSSGGSSTGGGSGSSTSGGGSSAGSGSSTSSSGSKTPPKPPTSQASSSTGCSSGSVCINNSSPPSGNVSLCNPATDPACSSSNTTLCAASDPSCSNSNCSAPTNASSSDSSTANCPDNSNTNNSGANGNTSSSNSGGSSTTGGSSSQSSVTTTKSNKLGTFLLITVSVLAIAGFVGFVIVRQRRRQAALETTNQVSFFDEYPDLLAQEMSKQLQDQPDQTQTNIGVDYTENNSTDWQQDPTMYPTVMPTPAEQPPPPQDTLADEPTVQNSIPDDMFTEGRERLAREEAERQAPHDLQQ